MVFTSNFGTRRLATQSTLDVTNSQTLSRPAPSHSYQTTHVDTAHTSSCYTRTTCNPSIL